MKTAAMLTPSLAMAAIALFTLITAKQVTAESTVISQPTSIVSIIRIAQELNYTVVIRHTKSYVPIQQCSDVLKLLPGLHSTSIEVYADTLSLQTQDTLSCVVKHNDTSTTLSIQKI